MATLCKNCGYPLVYDPISRKVVCDACSSAFDAESIEAYSKEFESASDAVQEFMECHVYSCNSCGGEIIINGSETSTTCIYCGSPSVIFNRISKERRPDFILPFQFSREQAVQVIKQRLGNGYFVPDEFKKITAESIRGIYIPYWLADVYHAESCVIHTSHEVGDSVTYDFYSCTGYMKFNNMLIEASMELNDESSKRLEPYDFRGLKKFDEEYLLGFYSDMSDINYGELRRVADERSKRDFRSVMSKHASGSSQYVESSKGATLIDKNLKYAFLPAWFVTIPFDGKPNTILVNGQTGKVVGGIPWNKKKFWKWVALASTIIGLIAALIAGVIGFIIYSNVGGIGVMSSVLGMIPTCLPILVISMIFLLIGIMFYGKVVRQIQRTQSQDTFNFTRKRQG